MLKTEIISADSRQVYKYLDIGTAKPSQEELSRVRHHFIDSLQPNEEFNVSRYENDALEIIHRLHSENKVPIVAGGSGLYIKALTEGITSTVETDEEYRAELKRLLDEKGREYLYQELQKADPESARNMLPQNWKRVIRALEVLHITGKPIWQHHSEYERDLDIEFIKFALNWPRDILYRNIEERVDKMLAERLVEETQRILDMGYSPGLNALNTVGYKEIISFINGEITLERASELIKRNTRRYAKRQMTWFRGDPSIKWIDINSPDEIEEIAVRVVKEAETKAPSDN